tara:strand:+ start:621 stop:818 length:198 start_codon:yes stop_codon:yes gene_type:complete
MNEEAPNKFIPREFKDKAYPWRKSKFAPIAKENLPNKTIDGKVLRVVRASCDCSVIGNRKRQINI